MVMYVHPCNGRFLRFYTDNVLIIQQFYTGLVICNLKIKYCGGLYILVTLKIPNAKSNAAILKYYLTLISNKLINVHSNLLCY